jgi:hypothetical protein
MLIWSAKLQEVTLKKYIGRTYAKSVKRWKITEFYKFYIHNFFVEIVLQWIRHQRQILLFLCPYLDSPILQRLMPNLERTGKEIGEEKKIN